MGKIYLIFEKRSWNIPYELDEKVYLIGIETTEETAFSVLKKPVSGLGELPNAIITPAITAELKLDTYVTVFVGKKCERVERKVVAVDENMKESILISSSYYSE